MWLRILLYLSFIIAILAQEFSSLEYSTDLGEPGTVEDSPFPINDEINRNEAPFDSDVGIYDEDENDENQDHFNPYHDKDYDGDMARYYEVAPLDELNQLAGAYTPNGFSYYNYPIDDVLSTVPIENNEEQMPLVREEVKRFDEPALSIEEKMKRDALLVTDGFAKKQEGRLIFDEEDLRKSLSENDNNYPSGPTAELVKDFNTNSRVRLSHGFFYVETKEEKKYLADVRIDDPFEHKYKVHGHITASNIITGELDHFFVESFDYNNKYTVADEYTVSRFQALKPSDDRITVFTPPYSAASVSGCDQLNGMKSQLGAHEPSEDWGFEVSEVSHAPIATNISKIGLSKSFKSYPVFICHKDDGLFGVSNVDVVGHILPSDYMILRSAPRIYITSPSELVIEIFESSQLIGNATINDGCQLKREIFNKTALHDESTTNNQEYAQISSESVTNSHEFGKRKKYYSECDFIGEGECDFLDAFLGCDEQMVFAFDDVWESATNPIGDDPPTCEVRTLNYSFKFPCNAKDLHFFQGFPD